MKKILAIFIIFSLFLQCTVQFAVIGMFELRKDYIVKHLCENRNRPQMKCCGKCYLNKQLNKVSSESNSSKNENKVEKYEVLAYIVPAIQQVIFSGEVASSILNPASQRMCDRLAIHSIFHPPSIMAA